MLSPMTVTGFLHPGEMGASVAAACRGDRLWIGEGRSEATARRAAAAGLRDVGIMAALVAEADTIVSVCPPDQALEVAADVAGAGFSGRYVDANAVSPATARSIAERFDRFVDGGIVGPPVSPARQTRLYLSGDGAAEVARLWEGTDLQVLVVEGGPGAASAVKMCFAAWTKGSAALMLAIRALAAAEHVEDDLLALWAATRPELCAMGERAAATSAAKAWRWRGEMEEIAASFSAHDLPGGFHAAAAELYGRMAEFKDAAEPPSLDDVVSALLAPG
jgi:3-hydroxyisobutyrate dehydrogenase-like beta-hydroxyacid dehydrogenase